MALTVYCDESETAGRIFTLAGWAGVPSAWDDFGPVWREMLMCYGPEPIRAFHMIDLASRRGEASIQQWCRRWEGSYHCI
jgi:hypothetical protein